MRTCLISQLTCVLLCWGVGAAFGAGWSFESGGERPEGWTAGPGGSWAADAGRSGVRSLEANTTAWSRAWSSDSVPLEPEQSCRLSGWIRCSKGAARIGMDLLDASGKPVASAHTPAISPAGDWQYLAVEEDAPASAAAVRLWFEVDGQAYLDDLVFVPMVRNLVYNARFTGDSKGRIGMWPEDTTPWLPGTRAGTMKPDPKGGRSGGSSMLIEPRHGWFAARMVDMPRLWGNTTFRFSGWSRAEQGEVRIWIAWVDGSARVLRADPAEPVGTDAGWTHWEAHVHPARGATGIRIAMAVHGGKAWFDDFRFSVESPARQLDPAVRVHVNQVGYEQDGPKSLVVATNFFPSRSAEGTLEIRSASGVAARLPLRCSGRIHEGKPDDWGEYYWRADFSSLRAPGRYTAVARVAGSEGASPPFEIGKDLLLRRTADLAVDFFFVQRCGFDVPGWHRACHLDDAKLPSGTHLDATGGWHSAGDYNKLMYENGDGGCAFALLSAYRDAPEVFAGYDRDRDGTPDAIDEALWGARFLAKMQIPENGGLYGGVSQGPGRAWTKWSPPELQTDNIIGTADDPVIAEGEGSSPLVIGAWVRLAAMPEHFEQAKDYVLRAIRLFDHATQGGTQVGSPHLLMSAMDLHAVTKEPRYLDFARRSVEAILATQQQEGRLRGAFGTYGELSAGALATFALTYPDDPLCSRIRAASREYIAFCLTTADNPFGLVKQSVGDPDYFFEPTSTLGTNFLYLMRAWAAAQIHRLTGDHAALQFATDQLDWVLGKNPIGLCMFEGKGTLNPPRYHHRYDSIPGHPRGAVPGAIPNGFVRSIYGLDQPGFDLSLVGSPNAHPSYRTSEPWLVHNMWYLMALSGLPRAR